MNEEMLAWVAARMPRDLLPMSASNMAIAIEEYRRCRAYLVSVNWNR